MIVTGTRARLLDPLGRPRSVLIPTFICDMGDVPCATR